MKFKRYIGFIPLICAVIFVSLHSLFYNVFAFHWNTLNYGLVMVLFALLMFASVAFCNYSENKSKKKWIFGSLLKISLWLVIGMIIPTVLLNNIIKIGETNVCAAVLLINDIVYITLAIIALHKNKKHFLISIIASVLCIAIGLLPISYNTLIPLYYELYDKTEARPMNLSTYTEKEYSLVNDADFYISADGNDEADGSFAAPFKTFERAKQAVRELNKENKAGIKVAVMAGEYRTSQIKFNSEDCGTQSCPVTYCAYGDGEVVINGGLTLKATDFSAVTNQDMLDRLSTDAQNNVVCADLTAYGLTADDWGKIYAIGSYNTAAKYDGDYVGGMYCELFFNDTRMNLARYPNDGWLKTSNIVQTGRGKETNGSQTVNVNWDDLRNPEGDTYRLSDELTKRVASWKTLDDVWMFGFFKYTWADSSTLIEKFDASNGNLTTKFVSLYGTERTAPYYFFNVFEELDTPGEWYLDRNTGVLYMYPTSSLDTAVIDFSVTDDVLIMGQDVDYLTIDGFTIKGTRGDAVNITGNHNTVKNCLIKNVGCNALIMTGYENLATENEITHTGKGGIYLDGGERESLTPGNNKADNNLIHDWSEVYQTYQPAVTLSGVGNICSHNEIYNSPHEAITYSGNNHVIEYNNIHNVCLLSDDAGAIYSGRHWDWYGTVIRYNMIADIYGDGHKACGIYMDDALSGQTIYGNFLVNIGSIGIHLGGGRDLIVKNNILVNCNDRAFSYDDRARQGAINNGWFSHSSQKDGDMWQNLYNSPWQSEVWQTAYPQYKNYSDDFDDTNSTSFVPNPALSEVTDNLVVNLKNSIGDISKAADTYSTIENNAIFGLSKSEQIFVDAENGDYRFNKNSQIYKQIANMEEIPFESIGRY